ncbi:MAG TPA: hypothetical protein VK324_04755 [Tepidisphaeraceae bacterium]|nr:hypothetical protein [Tepidisphaeraceae bacterium]
MKKLFRLFVTVLLVGGWALAASALHVVRTNDAQPIKLIPKDRLGFADTYVDVRTWTVNDAVNHPAVVARLIETGRGDALVNIASGPAQVEVLEKKLAEAKLAATTQPAARPVTDAFKRVEGVIAQKAREVKTSIFDDSGDATPAATQAGGH